MPQTYPILRKSPVAVKLERVWASYRNSPNILRNITMEVKQGENCIIMGHSGAGKTTLLKVVNGIIKPTKGQVKLLKTEVDSQDSTTNVKSLIGYIPQNLGLVKNVSVLDNVLMGSLAHTNIARSLVGLFHREDVDLATDAIESVGLDCKESRKIYTLSGGEKQRVALARALIQKPRLLLADEFVSELDYNRAREIMEIVSDIIKKNGITAIMIHHDIDIARTYGDRIVILNEGDKTCELKPEELNPAVMKKVLIRDALKA